jgi:ABC-type branched-subunit amino acid transport system ATPase component
MLRTFQTPQSFPALTSLENAAVTLPNRQRTGVTAALVLNPLVRRDERPRWRAAAAALDEVDMRDRADRLPTELSYGEQRMLELARVEAGEPTVVLLDEPSAGLNAAETTELAARLTAMRARGMSLVLVDHKIDFIQEVCDRVVVLELGRVVAEGDPVGIWRDERVVDVYLGTAPTVDEEPVAVDAEGGE